MRGKLALLLCAGLFAALFPAGHVRAQSTPLPIGPPRVKTPKKEKPTETQALPLPPEPPAAVSAETAKLMFHLSPLSEKGLLTQQVRDALKSLTRANGGSTFVKLRAFVAGSGDMRRVAAIVSEEFSDKKMPLPAVTTIQVGALPMDGAQVVIESISTSPKNDKKTPNPTGLAFFSARPAPDPRQAVAQLATAAASAGAVLLQATCFLGAIDQVGEARAAASVAFPTAAVNFVQLTRLAVQPAAACEGVGRLEQALKTPLEFLDAAGAVLVAKPRLVFTGAQLAFQDRDEDLRLAYGRLGRALETMKASYADSLVMSVYSLNPATAEKILALAPEFLGPPAHAVQSTQIVEGLPSLDATVAIELMAFGP